MMEKFIASNGVEIEADAVGNYMFTDAGDRWVIRRGSAFDAAFREFFLAERDAELGRWRWPEHPEYVVYRTNVSTRVRVLHETGVGELEWVDRGDSRPYEFVHAARAYFDAHPVPRPWENAKPGEVWALTDSTGEHAYLVDDGQFFDSARDYALDFDDRTITSGRRIWPEGETTT